LIKPGIDEASSNLSNGSQEGREEICIIRLH
jgi:hypothetical protein